MNSFSWTDYVLSRLTAAAEPNAPPEWFAVLFALAVVGALFTAAVEYLRARRFSRGGLKARREFRISVGSLVEGRVALAGTGPCSIWFAAEPVQEVKTFVLAPVRTPRMTVIPFDRAGTPIPAVLGAGE